MGRDGGSVEEGAGSSDKVVEGAEAEATLKMVVVVAAALRKGGGSVVKGAVAVQAGQC